ncbi:hypothetical protein VTJ83DRAFT_1917 [Remersonia thermophila]|uniref:Nucleoporin POM34 n=1 Tax=Remersonia thermophila TaxID=72144 RepID=A0ABR4DHA5_9PEZI
MSSSLTQIKSTPVKQTAPAAAADSPGNWKHPRLAEITRRQSKNTFSEKNARQIVYNVAAIAIVGIVRQVVLPALPSWVIAPVLRQYSAWISTTLLIVPLINIAIALLPLVRPRDDLSDIPLTPAQRKLLGLPPSSGRTAPAPQSPAAYSTPPRYSRAPSLAGSPAAASIKSYASSPLSTLGSPLAGPNASAGHRYSSPRFAAATSPSKLAAATFSPPQYSPSPAAVSPLRHKVASAAAAAAAAAASSSSIFGASTTTTTSSSSAAFAASTSSFASSTASTTSPLGASTMSSVFGDGPATPTPAGKRSSVGLNSKWLYEKGRRSSGSGWLHGSLS